MVDGGITIDGNSQPGQEQESTAQPSPGHSQALLTTLVILESLLPSPRHHTNIRAVNGTSRKFLLYLLLVLTLTHL